MWAGASAEPTFNPDGNFETVDALFFRNIDRFVRRGALKVTTAKGYKRDLWRKQRRAAGRGAFIWRPGWARQLPEANPSRRCTPKQARNYPMRWATPHGLEISSRSSSEICATSLRAYNPRPRAFDIYERVMHWAALGSMHRPDADSLVDPAKPYGARLPQARPSGPASASDSCLKRLANLYRRDDVLRRMFKRP